MFRFLFLKCINRSSFRVILLTRSKCEYVAVDCYFLVQKTSSATCSSFLYLLIISAKSSIGASSIAASVCAMTSLALFRNGTEILLQMDTLQATSGATVLSSAPTHSFSETLEAIAAVHDAAMERFAALAKAQEQHGAAAVAAVDGEGGDDDGGSDGFEDAELLDGGDEPVDKVARKEL